MRDIYKQYPEIYRKQNDTYLYFGDDGTRFFLVAGQDGVTEEWIHMLKIEHRKECNMIRETSRGHTRAEERESVFVSIDSYGVEYADRVLGLIDQTPTGIDALIRREKVTEFYRDFARAWNSLTEKQQQLIIKVRLQKIPQKEIANQLGISCAAVNHQLATIDKKMNQYLNKKYFCD